VQPLREVVGAMRRAIDMLAGWRWLPLHPLGNSLSSVAFWLVAGFVLLVVELLSGTFYLLMVALGCASAALCAYLGLEFTTQVIAGAAVGAIAIAVLHRSRWARGRRHLEPTSNPDLNLDLGQTVEVRAWQDGRARVEYRGSQWDAVPEEAAHAPTGVLAIRAIRGSTLVLGPVRSVN
jgi:membrane protein implicated in regulation of membrane protease activity